MYAIIGRNAEGNQTWTANAETTDEALYVTEAAIKRGTDRVEILRNGQLWLTLDADAFAS